MIRVWLETMSTSATSIWLTPAPTEAPLTAAILGTSSRFPIRTKQSYTAPTLS
jgi:hypothetical protein